MFDAGGISKTSANTLAEAPGKDPAEASSEMNSTSEAWYEPIGSARTQDQITLASKYHPLIRSGSPSNPSGEGGLEGYISGKKIYGEIKKIGLGREFAETEDGQRWTRKGNKPWVKLDMNAQKPSVEPVILAVIRKRQIEKDDHWCLFVGEEGSPGSIYQVIGDHLYMLYDTKDNVNIFASASFRDAYTVNSSMTEHQRARVVQLAGNTSPPQAPNPREITENCRTWVIKVLWQLQKEDVVSKAKIHLVESLSSPM